jgi:predicted small lipoprotein YifL
MNRLFLTIMALFMVSSCGVKGPLVAPKDIPAYEENQRKKRERLGIETPDDAAPKNLPAESAN